MNKNGSMMLGVIIAVMILMAGFLFIEFIKDDVTTARTSLNCSTPSLISDGTKILCLLVDSAVPYYIIILISVIAGWIGSKI